MPSEKPSPAPRARAHRPEPGDLPVGTLINGRFRVLSLLASGGMGRVYRAEQVPLGRTVALKVLRHPGFDDPETDEQFRKRFLLEANILSKLQHINVVTIYDYGRIEGIERDRYFMAMEFLAGRTLSERIRRNGPIPPQDALRILRQIGRGLREAHKLGAIHRDLKPSNVMLVPEEDGGEVAKILDFGIGKMVGGDEEQDLTQEGAFLGSPKYIAPEQVNQRNVDARTDVYSFGVIAYECLTGRVPFLGETNLETILAHCNSPVPPMAERSPAVRVPEVLESFVRRCLEKDPGRRPANMEEVLREILACERALFGTSNFGSAPSDIVPIAAQAASAPAELPPSGPVREDTLASNHGLERDRPSFGTQSPLIRSFSPRSGGSLRVLTMAIAGVVVVSLAVGVFLAVRTSSHGHAGTAAADTGSAAPTGAFTLLLESSPSGASVVEGDLVLGTTPMQLSIDHASVQSVPRHFVVKLDGYAPYTLLQGDSNEVVHLVAPLAAVAPPPPPSGATSVAGAVPDPKPGSNGHGGRRGPPPPPPSSAGTTVTHPQQESDIRLKR
jgi:serine/threonine protein kinase